MVLHSSILNFLESRSVQPPLAAKAKPTSSRKTEKASPAVLVVCVRIWHPLRDALQLGG